MEPLRIIISGGGTGGHIFPAIAIGRALQRLRPGTELLFVGANGKMEMEKVPLEGFRIVGLDIVGFNRSQPWKNIVLPFLMFKSRQKAKQIIKEFKPMAAVGVGGYASFPLLQAAQSANIPTLVQEQNSYAGKSNKILGRKAKAICVAYQGMERFFPAERIMVTGNPVREEIAHSVASRAEALQFFGLSPHLKTVLVVGGSLGARSINQSMKAGLEALMATGVQLVWQTGKQFHEEAVAAAKPYEANVRTYNFIREMAMAYAVADVVVSRAGALAIAELCIAGKPVIFVPYPFAAEGHQAKNARALEAKKAAMVVNDDDAGNKLISTLTTLLANEEQCKTMAANIKLLGIKDADDRIAHKILTLVNA